MKEVNKNTTLGEILKNYNNAEEVLTGFGMHCFSCPMSQMETVEEAGEVHGLDVDFMVKKLNEDLVAKKEQTKKDAKKKCGCKKSK